MKPLAGVAVLVATLALTACNNCPQPQSLGMAPAAMAVPMPAPKPPAPKPPAPKPPAPKAPAPVKAPAPPKPVAPKPTALRPPTPPRRYTPPPSIARPIQRPPVYDYRTIYVQHRTDHTPLLMMMVMSGMLNGPQPVPERCEQ